MYSLTVVFALQGKNVLVFWCGLLHFWFPIYFFFLVSVVNGIGVPFVGNLLCGSRPMKQTYKAYV